MLTRVDKSKSEERFLTTQADHFTGVKWKEKRRPAPFGMTFGAGKGVEKSNAPGASST